MVVSALRRGCRAVALFVLFVILACVAAGAFVYVRFERFQDTAIPGLAEGQTLQVQRGDSFGRVLRRLREAGITTGHDLEWQLLARHMDVAARLKVGEYPLTPGTSPRALLQRMRDGKVLQYRFTIVEGWNIRQLRAALAKATPLEHRTNALDDAALMQALGFAGQHPEGRFLPQTYVYTRGDTDLDVLKQAHAGMERALAEVWAQRAADLPLSSPEQALILASIVEKETGIAQERAQIAGVFARRLKVGMLLQTDPTVIYGLGSVYDGNIRRRDLTTDTPYNTYTRVGLTPTPIAMPGLDALKAAVNPASGDALFFVALGDGSGRHVFSATLSDHNAAVARYLRQLRRPPLPEDAAVPEVAP
ncbi:MAG: endolytic transglycosylase MltG [Pseudoxanthomonas sp.]